MDLREREVSQKPRNLWLSRCGAEPSAPAHPILTERPDPDPPPSPAPRARTLLGKQRENFLYPLHHLLPAQSHPSFQHRDHIPGCFRGNPTLNSGLDGFRAIPELPALRGKGGQEILDVPQGWDCRIIPAGSASPGLFPELQREHRRNWSSS